MLKISLLENALDYILDASLKLQETEADNTLLKYAIVHLWNGVELLLKRRLMDEHWALIFRDVNKAKPSALESGDFVSVYYDDILIRLRNICEVDLDNYIDLLNNLRQYRNRLEHYQIDVLRNAAISMLVKIWSFILHFCSSHFCLKSQPKAQQMFEHIKSITLNHEKYINSRLNEINPILRENEQKNNPRTVIQCPECFQNAMFISDDEDSSAKCLFCHSILPWKVAMERWLGAWNMKGPFGCLECGDNGLCRDDANWLCFCCGRKWDLDEFGRCTECDTGIFYRPSNYNLCEFCISSLLHD